MAVASVLLSSLIAAERIAAAVALISSSGMTAVPVYRCE